MHTFLRGAVYQVLSCGCIINLEVFILLSAFLAQAWPRDRYRLIINNDDCGGAFLSSLLCIIMGNRGHLFQWFMPCDCISSVSLYPKPRCCSCCVRPLEEKVDLVTCEIFKWKGISFQDRLMSFRSTVPLYNSRGRPSQLFPMWTAAPWAAQPRALSVRTDLVILSYVFYKTIVVILHSARFYL